MFPGIGLLGLPPGGLQKLVGVPFGGGAGRAWPVDQASIAIRANANFMCREFMASVCPHGQGGPRMAQS